MCCVCDGLEPYNQQRYIIQGYTVLKTRYEGRRKHIGRPQATNGLLVDNP
jgi:hypothetical protein